jgi:hypothetical protein
MEKKYAILIVTFTYLTNLSACSSVQPTPKNVAWETLQMFSDSLSKHTPERCAAFITACLAVATHTEDDTRYQLHLPAPYNHTLGQAQIGKNLRSYFLSDTPNLCVEDLLQQWITQNREQCYKEKKLEHLAVLQILEDAMIAKKQSQKRKHQRNINAKIENELTDAQVDEQMRDGLSLPGWFCLIL